MSAGDGVLRATMKKLKLGDDAEVKKTLFTLAINILGFVTCLISTQLGFTLSLLSIITTRAVPKLFTTNRIITPYQIGSPPIQPTSLTMAHWGLLPTLPSVVLARSAFLLLGPGQTP
jgi:hypothetical protein